VIHDFGTAVKPGNTAPDNEPLYQLLLGTLIRWVEGFAVAVVVGVSLGFLLGSSQGVYSWGYSATNLLRALPSALLFPFLIRVGFVSRKSWLIALSLISFGTVWPILFNTMRGLRNLPEEIYECLAFMKVSAGRRRLLLLRWAMPSVFSGLEIGAGVAFLLTVTAEMLEPNCGGLGWYVATAPSFNQGTPELQRMYGGLCVTALVGLGLNTGIGYLRCRFVPWEKEERVTYKLSKRMPVIESSSARAILSATYVSEELRRQFTSFEVCVTYQGPAYLLPDATDVLIKDNHNISDIIQRDVLLTVSKSSSRQTALVARSWIRRGCLSQQSQAALEAKARTIGDIVSELEQCDHENLGYRSLVSDRFSNAFGTNGTIRLIERTRLIRVGDKPAVLIQEYVQP
jgi:ABC-type nitrate/sulfonate/bicarbonate transport system permease component